MSDPNLSIYEAQLKALAAVREACATIAPNTTAEGLNSLAQALKIVVELECDVLEKQRPLKTKNPYAS